MGQEVSSYSAANVNLSFLGITLTGLAGGEDAITAVRNTKAISADVGIQGDGVLSQSVDRSGKITVKCLQNSATNKFLTAKMNATEAGVIVSGAMICDEVGSDAGFTANKTAIEGWPDFKRGAKANMVEWVFITLDLATRHGQGVQL